MTNERYINLNGKQVEIKKAEPRDGGGGYNKMGDSSQWGHHQGQMGMVQGPNGQMGGPPMNMHAPNMMPGYQNWGTSPQQGYGYGGSSAPNSYQGWGGPPQAPVAQWNNYGNPPPTQGYGGYDMYNSSSGPNSSGGNWSSWNIPSNNGGSATGSAPDMYNRSQTWTGNQSTGAPGGMAPRTGPGNSASKSGSEYEYSGYGSGYDYDYTNYGKEQGSSFVPRSYGETTAPPQYPPSQAV